jgi:outer membrane protein TolC
VEARRGAGLATELDVSRARTDRARARQTVLESELEVGLARRSLESISGLRPRAVGPTETEPASGPLSSWLAGTAALPAVRAARLDREAADAVSSSAWSDLLPTLSASADYRATNAAGFGSATSWTAGVSAVWTLDFAKPAAIDQASDERAIAAVRAARAERAAADAITESWLRARALHARLAAARAEEAHAARASELARARHATGRATQLELAQAERDAFAAGVSRIRAEADLAVATTELRVRAARIPGCEGGAR